MLGLSNRRLEVTKPEIVVPKPRLGVPNQGLGVKAHLKFPIASVLESFEVYRLAPDFCQQQVRFREGLGASWSSLGVPGYLIGHFHWQCDRSLGLLDQGNYQGVD